MAQIFIYTSYYPYSLVSESFLTPELKVCSKSAYQISLIPVNCSKVERIISDKIVVDRKLCHSRIIERIWAFISIIHYLPFFDFDQLAQKVRLRSIYNIIKYLYAANLVYQDLVKRASTNEKAFFYSYWLSYTPIAFALYKYRHPGTSHKFICRGHGSDIYGQEVGIYYPLRNFVFKYIDKVFVISVNGKEYLLNRYPLLDSKIHVSRLGVFSNYVEKGKSDIVRFVSCSNVIPLKRVNLIFQSIFCFAKTHFEYQIDWIHFGSGPLLEELKDQITRNKVSNLTCTLKGSLENKDILQFYRENNVTAFILLSTTEGIPVSIMEAISSGIPVIATNVGGVSEIVTKETGFLLDKIFQQEDFDKACIDVIRNKEQLAVSAYNFYMRNYNADTNFRSFYEQIFK